MSTAHSIAIGILITIGLLSVVGFIQLLMCPFVLASNVALGVADAKLRASETERVYRKKAEALIATELVKNRAVTTEELIQLYKKEVPDGRG